MVVPWFAINSAIEKHFPLIMICFKGNRTEFHAFHRAQNADFSYILDL